MGKYFKKRMDIIENFSGEPSMEKLERLRKSEIMKIGEKLELNVQNSMKKHELVRKITEHMVGENVFERNSIRRATEGNSKNDTRTN